VLKAAILVCFGSCQLGGGADSMVNHVSNLPKTGVKAYATALSLLADNFGSTRPNQAIFKHIESAMQMLLGFSKTS